MPEERILIVDDEILTLDLAEKILGQEGITTISAKSGKEALGIIEEENFDLLLTDVRMPGISGLELLQRFKLKKPDAAAVVFTGHGTIDMAMEAMGMGANGFILKPFTSDELINTVTTALEKVKLVRENVRLKSLFPLFEVSRRLMKRADTKELLDYIIDVAKREAGSDSASIMLNQEDGFLEISAAKGLEAKFIGKNIRVEECLSGQVVRSGEPLVLMEGREMPGYEDLMTREKISSALIVPIKMEEKVMGVINLTKYKGTTPPFANGDADFLSILAGQAAAAIENAKLVEGLKDLFIATVRSLSKAIDMKSQWTAGHSERVTNFALKVGGEMDLTEKEMENLELAGLLHDVGKIGTHEAILDKPSRLSEDEFKDIKKHPVAGCEMLAPIRELNEIMPAVRHHHEHFDGQGYPDGLTGEEIPFLARILAVADSYDAMSSDRPYMKRRALDAIMEEFKRCAGSQFDPEIVSASLMIIERQKEE